MIVNGGFHFILMNTFCIFENQINNLFPLMIPGIYAILCIATERIYIARSFNYAHRITQHYIFLNKAPSENYKIVIPIFNMIGILLVSVI